MKRKAGLPEGFKLDMQPPRDAEPDKPIRMGDYLDEVDAPRRPVVPVVRPPVPAMRPPVVQAEPASETELFPNSKAAEPSKPESRAALSAIKRTRLNVSIDGRKRLAAIVDRMAKYGSEPDVRASEVIEALVLALYEAREHLDLSNVRRRGKFGSPSHRNFPTALAESVMKAMAAIQAEKRID